ncbi:hypothetical protein VPH35_043534 [Triticum aestivum]
MAEEERLASGCRSQQRDEVQISHGWKVSASSRVVYPVMRLEGGHPEDRVRELGQRGGVDGSQLRGPRHRRLGWLVEVRQACESKLLVTYPSALWMPAHDWKSLSGPSALKVHAELLPV